MTKAQKEMLLAWGPDLIHYNVHNGSIKNSEQLEWLNFYNSLGIEAPVLASCGGCYDYIAKHLYAQFLELKRNGN